MDDSLKAETDALREAYAALNRGDVDRFCSIFDPQVERIEFEGTPHAGTFHGFEAVKAHVNRGRSTWAEGACEPERFVVAGDKIFVLTHVHVRLKDHADWLEGRTCDVFTFRNGKAIEFRTFLTPEEALTWARAEDCP